MIEHPKTLYDWFMCCRKHKLKVSRLEEVGDERFYHALKSTNSNISYGFWDCRLERGFIDPEKSVFVKEEAARKKASEWDVFGKN